MPQDREGRPASGGDEYDFSLIVGGPIYQLLRRSHLEGSAAELVARRILAFLLVGWLPLLALSVADHVAVGGGVAVPFAKDVFVHVRYLVAMPLLLVAELVVHQRMRTIVREFKDRRLVAAADEPRFDGIVRSAMQLRNSVLVEMTIVATVVIGGRIIWRAASGLTESTWYGSQGRDGLVLTTAGMWYVYVSVTLFQVLLFRWWFRLFVWMRFLWQVSRIQLRIVPTHPDGVGGLGFLSDIVHAFGPLLSAHGAMLSGVIANSVFHQGANALDSRYAVLGWLAGLLVVVVGPLLVFAPQLANAKREGRREYGELALRYVRAFDEKWLRGGAPPGEQLLGSADVQSLADMGGSFERVRDMGTVPVTRAAFLQLALSFLAPILPLALTLVSFDELLKGLLRAAF
jgi:hypothetical protein